MRISAPNFSIIRFTTGSSAALVLMLSRAAARPLLDGDGFNSAAAAAPPTRRTFTGRPASWVAAWSESFSCSLRVTELDHAPLTFPPASETRLPSPDQCPSSSACDQHLRAACLHAPATPLRGWHPHRDAALEVSTRGATASALPLSNGVPAAIGIACGRRSPESGALDACGIG